MNKLHKGNELSCEGTMEINRIDAEDQFLQIISNILLDKLDIGYKDRQIVNALFQATIGPELCKRKGLLEQYLHTQLDILAKTIQSRFSLSTGIDYDYAVHAKMNSLLDELEKAVYSAGPGKDGE